MNWSWVCRRTTVDASDGPEIAKVIAAVSRRSELTELEIRYVSSSVHSRQQTADSRRDRD